MKIETHQKKVERFEKTIAKLDYSEDSETLNLLKDKSEDVSFLIQEIEQLRPSYVYGKGENGDAAKRAGEAFNKIKNICEKILKGDKENERESENSN